MKLVGEQETPFQQGLKGDALDRKLRQIFDQAIQLCSQMWKDVKHGVEDSKHKYQYPTIVHPILCNSNDNAFFGDEKHEEIQEFLKKAILCSPRIW